VFLVIGFAGTKLTTFSIIHWQKTIAQQLRASIANFLRNLGQKMDERKSFYSASAFLSSSGPEQIHAAS